MKKYLLIPSLAVLLSAPAYPAENVSCPMSVICDYDAGQCNAPTGWLLDSVMADEPFSGQQVINLSSISGLKQGLPPNQVYEFGCRYRYGTHSTIAIHTYAQRLIGNNWIPYGFGKRSAYCSKPDPTTCYGEK